jgi:hypothetical protein
MMALTQQQLPADGGSAVACLLGGGDRFLWNADAD